jgi:cytochrome c oxidase assembly protein subunit 11
MSAAALRPELATRNRRVGLMALLFALAMLGLGYASAPLYRLFCQVTGFGGTTQRVSEAQASAISLSGAGVTIRFDANIERGMPWQFHPERTTDTIQLGGRRMAIYLARNLSDKPVTGTATCAGRALFQQGPVLLLHRADAPAGAGSAHAGGLFRRSQNARRP